MPQTRFWLILWVLLVSSLVACRQPITMQTDDMLQVEVTTEPNPPATGDALLFFTLKDNAGTAINDAVLDVRGDMTHAGMQPIIRQARGAIDEVGTYEIPFVWTMAGDWFIDVTVNLADGTKAQRRFEFTLTR